MRYVWLAALVIVIGCNASPSESEAPETPQSEPLRGEAAPTEAVVSGEAVPASPSELLGTWDLVEQRGYGPEHAAVDQTLTFTEDGQMVNDQTHNGVSALITMRYRVEEDVIAATVESLVMDGVTMDGAAGDEETTFRWRFEGERLVIQPFPADASTQDVYVRVE